MAHILVRVLDIADSHLQIDESVEYDEMPLGRNSIG